MKGRKNGGYSLVEVLVAIALLAIIVLPTCTSLVLSVRINARTDEMLRAQLAVSSAVETLMAEGIRLNGAEGSSEEQDYEARFTGVDFSFPAGLKSMAAGQFAEVTVSCDGVSVTTQVRVVPPEGGNPG